MWQGCIPYFYPPSVHVVQSVTNIVQLENYILCVDCVCTCIGTFCSNIPTSWITLLTCEICWQTLYFQQIDMIGTNQQIYYRTKYLFRRKINPNSSKILFVRNTFHRFVKLETRSLHQRVIFLNWFVLHFKLTSFVVASGRFSFLSVGINSFFYPTMVRYSAINLLLVSCLFVLYAMKGKTEQGVPI